MHVFSVLQNADGKTLMEVNMGMRDTDNIVMSCDLSRHTKDRQKSREFLFGAL